MVGYRFSGAKACTAHLGTAARHRHFSVRQVVPRGWNTIRRRATGASKTFPEAAVDGVEVVGDYASAGEVFARQCRRAIRWLTVLVVIAILLFLSNLWASRGAEVLLSLDTSHSGPRPVEAMWLAVLALGVAGVEVIHLLFVWNNLVFSAPGGETDPPDANDKVRHPGSL